MFNEDIERKLFEREFKTFSHTFNQSLCKIEGTNTYYSNIAQVAWESWKAAKQNIVPMNIKGDCRDIPIKVVGAPDISKSQGTN